jgi:hypothetical protein
MYGLQDTLRSKYGPGERVSLDLVTLENSFIFAKFLRDHANHVFN